MLLSVRVNVTLSKRWFARINHTHKHKRTQHKAKTQLLNKDIENNNTNNTGKQVEFRNVTRNKARAFLN